MEDKGILDYINIEEELENGFTVILYIKNGLKIVINEKSTICSEMLNPKQLLNPKGLIINMIVDDPYISNLKESRTFYVPYNEISFVKVIKKFKNEG